MNENKNYSTILLSQFTSWYQSWIRILGIYFFQPSLLNTVPYFFFFKLKTKHLFPLLEFSFSSWPSLPFICLFLPSLSIWSLGFQRCLLLTHVLCLNHPEIAVFFHKKCQRLQKQLLQPNQKRLFDPNIPKNCRISRLHRGRMKKTIWNGPNLFAPCWKGKGRLAISWV